MNVIRIEGRYYFNRRVPEEMRRYDPRKFIRAALKTDSKHEANKKAVVYNEQIENYWRQLADEQVCHSQDKFQKVLEIARQIGFSYQPISIVAALPLQDLLDRVSVAANATPKQVEAVLGGVDILGLTINAALEKYWDFTQDRLLQKSPNQIRKWKNPRIKAVSNFIRLQGDKEVKNVTKDDTLRFKDWWLGRIKDEKKKPSSANKDFIHLKGVLQVVSDTLKLGLDIDHLFKKIKIKGGKKKKKPTFTAEQIVSILENPKLNAMNIHARSMLYALAETGARPSEIANLMPKNIVLDAPIPFIHIIGEGRELKTEDSERTIPLTGYALIAFQNCPDGFPRYHDSENGPIAINKFLRESDLMPTDKHTVYSLRHSFQNRILSVNAPDRVQADLMGHKFDRPDYGDGASLEQKKEWLDKISLLGLADQRQMSG